MFFKRKHNYDRTKYVQVNDLSGYYLWQCTNCGKLTTLDEFQLNNLPKDMKYCPKGTKKNGYIKSLDME